MILVQEVNEIFQNTGYLSEDRKKLGGTNICCILYYL